MSSLPKNWLSKTTWNQLQAQQTTAHRIYTSSPHLYIEHFEDDLLISLTDNSQLPHLHTELPLWCKEIGFAPKRIFQRKLVKNPSEKSVPALIEGNTSLPLTSVVQENGVFYEIDFGASYSVGLFIDQRENRKYLRSLKPKKLLNCFSYTGAFSVAAALEGAETLSIDIAKPALVRCKKNFALNHLSTEKHRFLADDVRKVLPRLVKRGEKFDAIILDPPTFSRTKAGGAFQVERDFAQLLELAMACAVPRANIFLSSNSRNFTVETLKQIAKKTCKMPSSLALPPPPDIPAYAMPTSVWLAL